MRRLLLALLAMATAPATAVPATAAAAERGADEVVAGVQRHYRGVTKMQADFRQEVQRAVMGTTTSSNGRVFVAQPDKMRWDYDKPDKKYFISDGKVLWFYEPAAKQAYKMKVADTSLPATLTFLYGKGDIAEEFTAALDPGAYGGADDIVVKLTPKTPSAQVKHVWLVIDPSDFHVAESIVLEANDNVNHITFSHVALDEKAKAVKDSLFQFDAKKQGVKVIKGKP